MAMGRLNRPSIMIYGGTIKVQYLYLITESASCGLNLVSVLLAFYLLVNYFAMISANLCFSMYYVTRDQLFNAFLYLYLGLILHKITGFLRETDVIYLSMFSPP